jgi:hypothetical protein
MELTVLHGGVGSVIQSLKPMLRGRAKPNENDLSQFDCSGMQRTCTIGWLGGGGDVGSITC